jgi:hypothetical protein
MLRPNESHLLDKSKDENYYCAGSWPPIWVSDLDDNTPVPDSNPQDMKGRSACNAIPSYRWTGNYCCGDDTGNNTNDSIKGQFAFKEFFNDSYGGCWGGRYLANDERIMLLDYNVSNKKILSSCSNNSCTLPLPEGNVIVTNPHTDIYDLSFVDGGITRIGKGGVSLVTDAMLRAENVPLQVQYHDGGFYTCNGANYLYNLNNTNTQKPLIINDPAHRFGTCNISGIYFCDTPNGRNRGWDNEALVKYPYANLTMPDGPDKNFTVTRPDGTTVDITVIDATNRTYIKSDYNLIKNGGFENE